MEALFVVVLILAALLLAGFAGYGAYRLAKGSR